MSATSDTKTKTHGHDALSIAQYAERTHPREWRAWQDAEKALAACGGRGRRLLHPGLGQDPPATSVQRGRAICEADRALAILVSETTKSLKASEYVATGISEGGRYLVDVALPVLAKIVNLQRSIVKLAGGVKFYDVRVSLRQAVSSVKLKRGKSGSPGLYNWPALAATLRRYVAANGRFKSQGELIRWCHANVEPKPGAIPRKGQPDPKTVKEAIRQYNLGKIAGLLSG